MKTSNKLLVVITIVIVAYLVVFDAGLKAEYLKGDFKSRFFGMEELPIKDFSNVEHLSADVIDASIEKGPEFAIWLRKDLKDKVQIIKKGKTLIIKYIGTLGVHNTYFSGGIIITCPQLDSITTKPYMQHIKVVDYGSNKTYTTSSYVGDIDVVGFDQQKMVVKASELTQIELKNSKLENMEAIVGDNSISTGSLVIDSTNHIKLANIKVNGKSELRMTNPDITTLKHDFSDSVSLILTGRVLRLLK